MVDWVNAIFPRVLPAAEDEASGAVPYSPSTPHHAALPGAAATWHGFSDRDLEARKVVELAQGSDRQGARSWYATAATSTRIVPALKAAGIRFRAVEIDAAGREAGRAGPLRAHARAYAPRRPRGLARHPARAVGRLVAWLIFQGISRTKPEPSGNGPAGSRDWNASAPCSAPRSRTGCAARCATASRAPGSRSAARPAWPTPPTWRTPEIFLDELEKLEEAGELPTSAALADKLEELYAPARRRRRPRRGGDHDHPQGQGPGVRHRDRARPRPAAALGRARRCSLSRALPGGQLLLAPINETGGDKERALRIRARTRPGRRGYRGGAPVLRRRHARRLAPAPARLRQAEREGRSQAAQQARVAGESLVRGRSVFSDFCFGSRTGSRHRRAFGAPAPPAGELLASAAARAGAVDRAARRRGRGATALRLGAARPCALPVPSFTPGFNALPRTDCRGGMRSAWTVFVRTSPATWRGAALRLMT